MVRLPNTEAPPRRWPKNLGVCGGSLAKVAFPYRTVAPRGRCDRPTEMFLLNKGGQNNRQLTQTDLRDMIQVDLGQFREGWRFV